MSWPGVQVDDDAVLRQLFDGQVAPESDSLVGALTAALRRLWRGLIQDTGQQEKDCPQSLK